MADHSTLILHQYDASPFSEKVRLGFGVKGLSWAGVDIPTTMPKPDLMPLTGGYRKTPVMQIGADIYCDSQLIFDELEVRHPAPSFYPGGVSALSHMMGRFCDRDWFQATVAIIFGTIGDMVPEDFKKDREALMGRPFDTDAMKAAIPLAREQLKVAYTWVDQQLSNGRDFLEGPAPGLSDIHAYLNVWFLGNVLAHENDALLTPSLGAWFQRLVDLGHGTRSMIDAKDALVIAREATPSIIGDGPTVTVMADDYGKDPVSGTLVADTAERTVIVREDPAVGQVAVHFPKAGFLVIR